MKKTYIFDLDGTLVDSMPTGVGIVLGFLKEKGISYPDDIVETLTPLGYKGVAEYFATHFALDCTAESIFQRFQEQVVYAYGNTIPLKKAVKETLMRLREQGHGLNVLTASPHLITEICLKRYKVFDLFDHVWSIEDFGMTKADPRIYLQAAERLGVLPTDCVMVDDNVNVLKTAKKVGMQTVGVYEEMTKTTWLEMQRIADIAIYDFSNI